MLVQGQWPKRRLIERFREGDSQGAAAAACWWPRPRSGKGVDVPGDALQLVIIDKLPFPPPGDPLVEARAQRLEAQGRSAFNDYFVPEAAVALKQGAGRLIRRESDQGVLVVCDTRLATMGYGRRLLAALPPMRRLASKQEFEETLERLARYQTFHHGSCADLKPRVQVFALRVGLLHHALRVVAQLGHAQRVVGAHQDEQGLFQRRHVLVVGQRVLRAVDGGDVGAAAGSSSAPRALRTGPAN